MIAEFISNSPAYLESLYRKFGTHDPEEGWNTLICFECGCLRGQHRSSELSCRCPEDYEKKSKEYNDNPTGGCHSSLEYYDSPVVDKYGTIRLISLRKRKEKEDK